MRIAIDLTPSPSGEVRHLYQLAAIGYGSGSEFSYAGPLRGVIYVHIQRFPVAQTPYKTIVHNEIHTAVSAYLFSLLLIFQKIFPVISKKIKRTLACTYTG